MAWNEENKMTAFGQPKKQYDELKKEAEKQDRSISYIIVVAIKEYLERKAAE
jgi:predicted transcriptional regulator